MPCSNGVLRHGLLLRSAAPLDGGAQAAVADLDVATVFDLRTALERDQQPTLLPHSATAIVADMLADASYAGAANLGQLAAEALGGHHVADGLANRDLRQVMLDSYRDFAMLPSARRSTAQVIQLLAMPDTGPVLIHCTAGKDRTGWLIAVILRILGVDWESITTDYLASGPAVQEMFSRYRDVLPEPETAMAVLAPVLGVFPEYLQAALAQTDLAYGSFPDYVSQGLGISDATIAELRARLVQSNSASALM